jgi:hypothetical protein
MFNIDGIQISIIQKPTNTLGPKRPKTGWCNYLIGTREEFSFWCGVSASGNFATLILVHLKSRKSPQLGTSGSVGDIYFRGGLMKNGSSTCFDIFVIVSSHLRTIQLFKHITFCPEYVIIARTMEKLCSPFDLPPLIVYSHLILRFRNTWQLLPIGSEIYTWKEPYVRK